jgi:hypothetical protein
LMLMVSRYISRGREYADCSDYCDVVSVCLGMVVV